MSDHLNAKQLNGYIHQALTDAARESIDAHLADCQLCRGQLAEHTALQQRLRYELLGELNSVHAPLSLSSASAIDRRRRAPNFAWVWRQSMRILAGLTALVVVVLVAASAIYAARQTPASSVTSSSSSRVVFTNGYAGGWYAYNGNGADAQDYEVGLDSTVLRSGQASAYISSTQINPRGFGSIAQSIQPIPYIGRRLRLSGYLKTEGVTGRAGLWMNVAGTQDLLTSDNMTVNRPVSGTTDWQKYDIVLDVPPDGVDISFGAQLIGSGQVWVDDIQLEIVGNDVATTALSEEMIAAATTPEPTATPAPLTSADLAALDQPANLSFETGTTGWSISGDTQNYVSGIDSTVTFDGQNSGYLAWDVSKPIGLARLLQSIKADQYRGQRVRVSANVKSDQIGQRNASFLTAVYTSSGELSLADNRSMYDGYMFGTTWQNYELVFDVAEDAIRIVYGISLNGQGRIWLDNVQVEVVGKDVPVTTYAGRTWLEPLRLKGVDRDGTMPMWYIHGSRPQDYEMGFDNAIAHRGRSSAYIKSIAPVTASDFGTLDTGLLAINYQGKRVRLSAYIKAAGVKAWAGLWMRVDGPATQVLAFDNMQGRPIQGTSDWQKYEVVLDVPDNSVYVAYGILVSGEGEVWFDDVQLEAVGDDVPLTNPMDQSQLVNPGFEPMSPNDPGSLPAATPTPIQPSKPLARFGSDVTLLSADLPQVELQPGATSIDLSLHWMVSSTNSALTSFVHVLDLPVSNIIAQSDQSIVPAATSTQSITLQLPVNLPPGKYQIVMGVYDAATGSRLKTDKGLMETWLSAFEIVQPSPAGMYLPWTAGVTHCVTGDATSHGPSVHELDFDLDNEPILAVQAGTVITAGFDGPEGYAIQIRHADGTVGFYSHLSRIDVANDEAIKRGQVIGLSGSTGASTGPHLAFKVLLDSDTTRLIFNETDHELRTGECIASQNQSLP